jgi:hypothetical protein
MYIKGHCHKIFTSGFVNEWSYPGPLAIPVAPYNFCRKFANIFAAQGAPQISMIQATKKLTKGVVDTGDKFTAGVNDTGNGHIFLEIYINLCDTATQ